MTEAMNKTIVRQYLEQVWNRQRLDMFHHYFSEDVVPHGMPGMKDAATVRGGIDALLNGIPDLKITVEDLVAEGDRVAVRFATSGTQQGELRGMPATGKPFTMTGMAFFRIVDDKIAEFWALNDTLAMMQQIGLLPTS